MKLVEGDVGLYRLKQAAGGDCNKHGLGVNGILLHERLRFRSRLAGTKYRLTIKETIEFDVSNQSLLVLKRTMTV